ncbi:MAG: Ig-like domain repeat protein, partial [Methanobrevibacter sp.]|nr:Ig-like domain repeat protein [Methanobrevibacter sp.]
VNVGYVELYDGDDLIVTILSGNDYIYETDVLGVHNITAKYIGGHDENYEYAVSDSSISQFTVESNKDTEVNIALNTTTVIKGAKLLITTDVTSQGSSLSFGIVQIYINDNYVANVTAGQSYEYYNENTGDYTVYLKYLENTLNGVTYLASQSESKSFTIKDLQKFTVTLGIQSGGTGFGPVYLESGNSPRITVYRSSIPSDITKSSLRIYKNGVSGAPIGSGEYATIYLSDGLNTLQIRYPGDDNYAAVESNVLYVYVGPFALNTTTEITLNPTEVSAGETISVIPVVKYANGTVISDANVDLYDGDDNLIESNVATGVAYTYSPSQSASGTYYVYAVYAGTAAGSSGTYINGSKSSKESFSLKGALDIVLTVNGDSSASVIKNGDITLKASSDYETTVDLYINGVKINDASFSTNTDYTYSLPSSYDGNCNISVKFNGDGNYIASQSNNVSVSIITPLETTTTVTLNESILIRGNKVLIKPVVKDENDDDVNVGTVTIQVYSSYAYAWSTIGTVDVGQGIEYTLDAYTTKARAIYNGETSGNPAYSASEYSPEVSLASKYLNSITLNVDGQTEITVKEGQTITFSVKLDHASGYSSVKVNFYVDGEETSDYLYLYAGSTYTKELTFNNEGIFNYTVYYPGDDSYLNCTSNIVKVTVEKILTK